MIYLVRSARALQGHAQAALPWAVAVAHHITENYTEVTVEVVRNINGPIDQVHWVARYATLTDMEAVDKRLLEDNAYQELVGSFQSIFDLSTAVDNIYTTVP